MRLIRKALLSLAFASIFSTPGISSAAIIEDAIGPTIRILDASGFLGSNSYTFTHTITDNGFNPLTDVIKSADMKISLLDALLSETWKVSIGLGQVGTGGPLPNFSFTDLDFALSAASIIDLADGAIKTTITATRGSFSFIGSELTVDITPNGQVPEPGMLALFGVGLFGLIVARRRKF